MTEIRTVGVCGAGTMGSGIAIVAARAGYRVVLYDTHETSLERARRQTEGFFGKSVERGKLTREQADAALAASGCGREDRVVGMHFCLPAQLMKLVEMSPGLNTSEDTFKAAWAFCEGMGQRPVKTKDTPGFVLNYFLVPFNNDVIRLIEAGVAEPADVDRAIKAGLGYKMGPCELLDLIGLDTQVLLCEAFYGVTHDPRCAAPPLLKRMVAAGHLGRKSGRGFFTYDRDAMYGG